MGTSSTAAPSSSSSGRRSWPPSSAGKRAPLAPMPAACRIAIGSPNRPHGSSPTRGKWPQPKRISGMPSPNVVVEDDADSGATRVSVFTPDREALFYRICAGLAAGRSEHHRCAHPHDARRNGARQSAGARWTRTALRRPAAAGAAGQIGRGRARSSASPPPLPAGEPQRAALRRSKSRRRWRSPTGHRHGRRYSRSMRVTGRHCSPALAAAIHDCGHVIHSAHIATYGERAVDVFYLTDARRQEAQPGASRGAADSTARGCARAGQSEGGLRKRPHPAGEAFPFSTCRAPAPRSALVGGRRRRWWRRTGQARRRDHRPSGRLEAAEAVAVLHRPALVSQRSPCGREAWRRRSSARPGTSRRAGGCPDMRGRQTAQT